MCEVGDRTWEVCWRYRNAELRGVEGLGQCKREGRGESLIDLQEARGLVKLGLEIT